MASSWPKRVRVIGLEPKAVGPGLELAESVEAGVPGLIAAVGPYLATWQREDAWRRFARPDLWAEGPGPRRIG